MKQLQPFDLDFSGINLVEASAGTGKTYNITSLYIRALIELKRSVSQILVVTFTDAATKELKDRLLKRISESIEVLKTGRRIEGDQFLNELLENVDDPSKALVRLREAVRMFDEAAIYTIHGFCYQVLQEQAFVSRTLFGAEMIGDDSELLLEVVDDFWRNWVRETSEDPAKRPLLKFMYEKGCDPEEWAKELGAHLGKPHLKLLPQESEVRNIQKKVARLQDIHDELRRLWGEERDEIRRLLDGDEMSNYRSDWLDAWFRKADSLLSSGVASIDIFEQFIKFTQTKINNSLKKPAIKKGTPPPQHPFFKLADEYWELAQPLQSYESLFKKNLLEYVRRELNERKQELGVLSYDDLLLHLQDALQNPQHGRRLAAALNEKYPIALVDEFQDTDPAQYNIFRRIYEPRPEQSALFMIGDPKQSIYSFRGADVYAYIQARKDADPDKMFNLGRNFRSTPHLIKGINTLFGGHSNPFVVGNISFEAVEPGRSYSKKNLLTEYGQQHSPVRFRKLPYDEKNATKRAAKERASADTAEEINRLIEGGRKGVITLHQEPLKAKDIAVLVQTHRQAGLMKEALQEKGIKTVQYSQESVFKTNEARQLEILLKAVAEPANEGMVKTALSMPLMKYSAAQLFAIEENEEKWLEVLEQFTRWHQQWQEHGFQYMFRSLLKEADVCEHVIKYPDGERRLTNILHLGELLQAESRQRKSGSRGLLKWLRHKRNEDKKQQEDEAQLRLESDEELVKIVTMHSSKGLEYPIVFCPFLWKGPKYEDRGKPLTYHPEHEEQACLDFSGKTSDTRKENRVLVAREELAESMRLAYVAMTRAKQCCYITATYAAKTEFSPLGYLFLEEQALTRLEETIHKTYDELGGKEIMTAIEELCAKEPELFTLKTPAGQQELGLQEEMAAPELQRRIFHRPTPLRPKAKVSSFSSLSSSMKDDYDGRDYDQLLDLPGNADIVKTPEECNIFSFPKGAQPGNCIHNIFEELDFADVRASESLIRQKLTAFGIDEEWEPVVMEMLDTVVHKPLLPDEDKLSLSGLSQKDYIPELEFYYQSDDLQTSQLLSLIRDGKDAPAGVIKGYANEGFLKGFIDLTFRFGDKFFLLDYKTNYLGDSLEDYRREELQKEMMAASYDLQYHIYCIALHRYLGMRMPGYSYEKNFGGSFYLFVRGINREGREGIFYDRPEFTTIQQLDEYISEGVLQ